MHAYSRGESQRLTDHEGLDIVVHRAGHRKGRSQAAGTHWACCPATKACLSRKSLFLP